ncbi:8-oxo-dGDP phosphatase NUDT18 [Eublepharis macularius]|uniref:8-oxo-dGDP phosphatase NUDT18 n=1 Tax=Eublepharis macularius TaxID=481883 RepID=A0AA97KBF5_EUBMA|nr:8-oxo-dGDP phosphatase NUDT18 [Eublepharis macularius]
MAEEELESLLSGKGWPVPEQGDAGPPPPLRPVCLRKDTCYVVMAVLLNEKKEVLVMQEAKPECHGMWYLPAGRMEPRETIAEAMQREVKEETGLECQPLTLLAVEERGPVWLRFVFLAKPTGGTLKSLKDADAESLQAQWWDRKSALPLRARDILPLIDLALQYQSDPCHPPTLPTELPCAVICQRLLAIFTDSNGALWVLLGRESFPHLPIAVSSLSPSQLGRGLLVAVHQFLQECLLLPRVVVQVQGLLGLEHLGKDPGQSDGICLNTVLTIGDTDQCSKEKPPELRSKAFFWWKVKDEDLKNRILHRLNTSAFIPIHS